MIVLMLMQLRLQISLDGKSAYHAFANTTRGSIFVQQVDPSTAIAVGGAVEISGARQGLLFVARAWVCGLSSDPGIQWVALWPRMMDSPS